MIPGGVPPHAVAQIGRTYAILAFGEVYLVFSLIKLVRYRKVLDITFNTGTLKESMEKVRNYFKTEIKKAMIIGLGLGYSFVVFSLIDIFLAIDGFGNLNFSTTGPNIFSSYFAVFVVLMLLAIPSIVKFEP